VTKKVAIMQPTYLPWLGYFHLLAHADVFVLLDDAQFCRQSWHHRNRILVQGHEYMLSIPARRHPLGTPLQDVMVDYARDWTVTHTSQLHAAYGKSPHIPHWVARVAAILDSRPERLLDVTVPIFRLLAEALGLEMPVVTASSLGVSGVRSERLLAICRALGATDYLSPAGAEDYLREDGFGAQGDVRLWIQRFVPQPYAQPRTASFVPYLSALDLLAHHGPQAVRDHLSPWCFEEVTPP
jgi:hypothetical protein